MSRKKLSRVFERIRAEEGSRASGFKSGRARWRGLLSLIGKLSRLLARNCWTAHTARPAMTSCGTPAAAARYLSTQLAPLRSSASRLRRHGFCGFYSFRMMAYVYPDGNNPLPNQAIIGQTDLSMLGSGNLLVHHAFSFIAGDMLSSPLWINPSGFLGQPTSSS